MSTKTALPYYNFDKLYSYNGTFNFLVGARGLGKTYGEKIKAIKDALNKGDEFIYLRRYAKELQRAKDTFFADVEGFEDWDFRVNGGIAEAAPAETRDEKKRPWKAIGYFFALSTVQSVKSMSFPKVKKIIFDEFIIEKGMIHYIPNEVHAFLNFYSTVDRNKDKTKVFFLANSVSMMNPYFLEWDIKPDQVGEWYTTGPEDEPNFLVCHFAESAEFATAVYETKFGKFIKNTEFADFAVGSKFKDANDAMIGGKPSTAVYHFSLESKAGVFSVWVDGKHSTFYCQGKRPKQEILFTLIPERMDTHKFLTSYNDKPLQFLRAAFNRGDVYFDEAKTRNAFAEIFKR